MRHDRTMRVRGTEFRKKKMEQSLGSSKTRHSEHGVTLTPYRFSKIGRIAGNQDGYRFEQQFGLFLGCAMIRLRHRDCEGKWECNVAQKEHNTPSSKCSINKRRQRTNLSHTHRYACQSDPRSYFHHLCLGSFSVQYKLLIQQKSSPARKQIPF